MREYDRHWRPRLCEDFPRPRGDAADWTRAQAVHFCYHQPDYFCPEPYEAYPSHMHIDLLERARGQGIGRRMMERLMRELGQRGSPGAHLCVSAINAPALGFYRQLGFHELARASSASGISIYLGKTFRD